MRTAHAAPRRHHLAQHGALAGGDHHVGERLAGRHVKRGEEIGGGGAERQQAAHDGAVQRRRMVGVGKGGLCWERVCIEPLKQRQVRAYAWRQEAQRVRCMRTSSSMWRGLHVHVCSISEAACMWCVVSPHARSPKNVCGA